MNTLTLTDDALAHVKALVDMDLDAADGDQEFQRVAAGSEVQTKIEALTEPGEREILIHLNVTPPNGDERDADTIARQLLVHIFGVAALNLGHPLDTTTPDGTRICVPLYEEV